MSNAGQLKGYVKDVEAIRAHLQACGGPQTSCDQLYRDIEFGNTILKENPLRLYSNNVTLLVKCCREIDAYLIHTHSELAAQEGSSHENQVNDSNSLLGRQVQAHESWKEAAAAILAENLPQSTAVTWVGHTDTLVTFKDAANITHIQNHTLAEVIMPNLPDCSFAHRCANGKRNFYLWQRRATAEALVVNQRRHLTMAMQLGRRQQQAQNQKQQQEQPRLEIKYTCDDSSIVERHSQDAELEAVIRFLFREHTHVFLTPLGATASGSMLFRVHGLRWSDTARVAHEKQTLLKVGKRSKILKEHATLLEMHNSTPSVSASDTVIEHTLDTKAPSIIGCSLSGVNMHLNGQCLCLNSLKVWGWELCPFFASIACHCVRRYILVCFVWLSVILWCRHAADVCCSCCML